ncbi:MAG TPA: hypothetical protein VMG12_26900 [Polyangiaceae bacterium]|nr:hypothetical protein [Polyangiaceae bacterium]
MTSMNEATVRSRVRRAYELGRWLSALRLGLIVIPMALLSGVVARAPVWAASAGLALFALVAVLGWRGQSYGRAVVPGLLAGSVPLVLPLLMRSTGLCCVGGVCLPFCMLGCTVGGLVVGISLGLRSAAERQGRWTFLAAATSIAALAGILGCAIVGTAGIAGMLGAVVVSSLPVAVAARSLSRA